MHYHTQTATPSQPLLNKKTYAPSLKGGINTLILRIHVQYKKEYYASMLRPTFSARM